MLEQYAGYSIGSDSGAMDAPSLLKIELYGRVHGGRKSQFRLRTIRVPCNPWVEAQEPWASERGHSR